MGCSLTPTRYVFIFILSVNVSCYTSIWILGYIEIRSLMVAPKTTPKNCIQRIKIPLKDYRHVIYFVIQHLIVEFVFYV